MACDKEPSLCLFTTLEPPVRARSCSCITFPSLHFWLWRFSAAHSVGCLAEKHASELTFSTAEIQNGLKNTWHEPGLWSHRAAPWRSNLNWVAWDISLRLTAQEHLSIKNTQFYSSAENQQPKTFPDSHSSQRNPTPFQTMMVNKGLLNGGGQRKASCARTL